MYDFDSLLNEVVRSRPDISRESLMERIREKKQTVGSGYLTDQGALFLIAGELGVRLQHMISADLTLKDLQIGANDITVVARVLAIYSIAEFNRKDGSGVGRYRRVKLFDKNGVERLTIWEDNEEAMKLSGISVDTPVRLVSAYVKQAPDGKPNLNLGKRGRIEVVADQAISSKLVSLSGLTKTLDDIRDGEFVPAVEGTVASGSRSSTFIRRDDNSSGSLFQFEFKGPGDKTTRVVIWDGTNLTEVKLGSMVRVTNLRHKNGRQGSELHGDEASVIHILAEDSKPAAATVTTSVKDVIVKVADISKHPSGKMTLEVMALSKGSVREVNLKDGSTTKKGEVVLGDDTGEITAVAWDEASKIIGEINVGEKVRVHDAVIQISKMGVQVLDLGRSSKVERF